MTETLDARWPRLLAAARTWRAGLIAKTSTGTLNTVNALLDAVAALDDHPAPDAGPWREPADETEGYPNLWVHDGRVTGQITIGQSRLPLSAIIGTVIHQSWEDAEDGWAPAEHYDFTADDLSSFLYDLLQVRGELARVLLALANAERVESEREDAVLAEYADQDGAIMVKVWPPGDDAVELPPAWWEDDELRRPVVEALHAALAALT